MEQLEVEVIRTGSSQPAAARHYLRAGPLLVTLEAGALRNIRLLASPPVEVLSGIYAAVRDHNWQTIAPRFLSYDVKAQEDAFQVSFVAEHVTAEVDFIWQGTISGSSAGEITFTLAGQARRSFRKNRIGFCVLHPMALAGAEVEVETPHGTQHSVFPSAISPHQPFKDIRAMRYACAPASTHGWQNRVELRLSGELFEMEDQRNWTDASYKTYCTPLHLPFPVELAAGTRITQRITLRPLDTAGVSASPTILAEARPRVTVSLRSSGKLPALGFGLAQPTTPLAPVTLAHLRALRPAYLWAEIDLARAAWENVLENAREQATLLPAELELSVVCDDAGRELAPLFRLLAARHMTVARLSCFAHTSHVTTRAMLEQARVHRAETGLTMQLGAGSRANFAEFNRATLPLDLADLVTYPINPQVHAFDQRSLVETLPAQAVTADNARRLAQGLPLSVGPITLKPRFNAAATVAEEESARDILPASVDARQMSLFGAGWTLGSLRHLGVSGARWLTYYETTGWRGLLEQAPIEQPRPQFPHLPGALFPLYHVFADIAEFQSGALLAVEHDAAGRLEALAMRQERRLLLLLANLTSEDQELWLHLPNTSQLRARVLDETTARQAMYEPERFRSTRQPLLPAPNGQIALELLPCAVLHIEGELEEH
ncbi:MAG TPA: hypothetical protein VHD63_23350 [Ktedonobacteraceae bacterium]|nr:hypothetical protein [Ktedonobacteraceae bacterium]